jgi:asparagine synthase (glutamine-hydrolysing)
MCGIAGIVALSEAARGPTREELVEMAGALEHRGPDEMGVYIDDRAGLAHARLSIIDLSTGQQPLANEDGTLWISYNGEIFNYVELRAELEALGHRFATKSDTEVIVHGYEAWGNELFPRMNGQWAIALWDARKGTLVLSRDRVGIRPLHLCEHRGRLYFSSEVKAIFAADESIPREFDPLGIDETLTFWSVVPPRTVFRGVSEVRPGHVRTYRKGSVEEVAYYGPGYPPSGPRFKGSFDDAVVAVREAMESATALRMLRADVPVGSYLSGGLDSSLVAALGLRAKKEKFTTFSLRFDDAEYDETRFQRRMAEHLGSEHREVVVSRADIAEAFPDVIRHAERPILRTAPAPLFLLSKLVHGAGIKVVLTGEGADEVFGGYDLFREGKVRRFWAKHPDSKLRPLLLDRLYPYLARSPVAQRAMARQFFGRNLSAASEPGFAHDTRWRTTSALKRLLGPEMRAAIEGHDAVAALLASLPAETRSYSPLAQDQLIEIRTLLAGYLLCSQGDRMLMAHSIEGRFPFLDKNVLALADSLPDTHKLHVLSEKHVLKRAAAGLVPPEIIARTKQPYRAPDALSFVGAGRPAWIDEVMSAAVATSAGVFDPRAVGQLWTKCLERGDDSLFSNADNMALVAVLSTHLLHRDFIARRPRSRARVRLKTLIDRTLSSPTPSPTREGR